MGLLVTALTCGCQHCCFCSKCQPSAPGTASSFAPVVHKAAKVNPAELARTPTGERFEHDPNYRWLVGTIEYSRVQGAWILHYVPFEEVDRYGGCVMRLGTVSSQSR
jgi:hypothetical protein